MTTGGENVAMRIGSPFLHPNEDQIILFRAIWAASASGTKWPTFEFVEDRLDDQGLVAREVVESCPRYRGVSYGPLWWSTPGPPRRDGPIVVTLAGLAHCPETAETVDAFLAVVRTVADKWHALPQDPHKPKSLTIRYADIADALTDGSLTAPKHLVDTVLSLADHEPPTWGGSKSGEDTEWTWDVAPEVKRYRNAYSTIEYLSLVHAQIGDHTEEPTVSTASGQGARRSPRSPTASPRPNGAQQQHAFISYVHEDTQEVNRLQKYIEAADIRVWRDTKDLSPGDEWKQKIRDAITSNTLVFIACFSDNSASKLQSYQNEELVLAIEQFRQRKPGHPWLIPVRLSDCTLPYFDIGAGRSLDSLQHVDLFGPQKDEGIAKLVAAVSRMMNKQGVQNPSQLSSEVTLPRASLLNAVLAATKSHHEVSWNLHADLYVEADPISTFVIPEQRCQGKIVCDELGITALLDRFAFHMPFGDTHLVQALPGQVAYRGPGTSNLVAGGLSPLPQNSSEVPQNEVTLQLELWPALSDKPLRFEETLQPTGPSDDAWAVWIKPRPQPAFLVDPPADAS